MESNKINYELINNFINYICTDEKTSSFVYLDKISSFLSKKKCEISKDIIKNLIKNNSNFSLILTDIVSNTEYLDYISNPLSMKIIDAYFEYKQNDLYNEVSYDEEGFITDSVREYLSSISKIPILTEAEERELAILSKNGDKAAKDKLIQSNLKFVVSIAKRYVGNGRDILDLIQDGNLGLLDAVNRFDPEKGFRFTTYSYWWIRQKIIRSNAENNRNIRLPLSVYNKIGKIKNVTDELKITLHREPSFEEISEAVKISLPKLVTLYPLQYDCVSMESSVPFPEGDDDRRMADFLSDEDYSVEKIVIKSELDKKVFTILKNCGLTDKQVDILMLRSGFDGEVRTLEYIAKKYGVSRERARQYELRALEIIRQSKNIESVADLSDDSATCLKRNNEYLKKKQIENFYAFFEEYSTEEVNTAIEVLSEKEKEVLNYLFDISSDHDIDQSKLRNVKYKIKHILDPNWTKPKREENRIRKKIKQTCTIEDNTSLYNDEKKQDCDLNDVVEIDEEYIHTKLLELSNSFIFHKLKEIFSDEQTLILVLSLGYIDYKKYTNLEISKILCIDKERVEKILTESLPIYNKNIDRFIDEIVMDSTNRKSFDNQGGCKNGKQLVKK